MDIKEKVISSVVYLCLGFCMGLVAMILYIVINQNQHEARHARINYQNGCVFISTKIAHKFNIESFDYLGECDKISDNIELTYIDLSIQMDKIKGY